MDKIAYPAGTKFKTPQGICSVSEADGFSCGRKIMGCHNFWCATYEIRRWLEKDWEIINDEA
jgi:hypothetical protein